MNGEKRVVITGIGPLCSLGVGKNSVEDSLFSQETNIEVYKHFVDNELWDSFYVHKIRSFDISGFHFDKYTLNFIDEWKNKRFNIEKEKDLLYLLSITKLALEDSKINYDANYNDIGLVLTHENPGLYTFFDNVANKAFDFALKLEKNKISKRDFIEKLYLHFEQDGYDLQTFMYLFYVAKMFNIHGYSLFLNNACASGLYALEIASSKIKDGTCSAVIVAAADCPLDIYKYLWFKRRNLYSEDGIVKAFSDDADGTVFGDGGAAIVLEEFTQAKKRGAFIYGEYLGGGFSLEGWKVMFPAIAEDYYKNSLKKALEKSNIKLEDIDIINLHGVGLKITDNHEANVISETFDFKDKKKPYLLAFKGLIGHNLGGCAILEIVLLLLCLQNNKILPLEYRKNLNKKIKKRFVESIKNENLRIALKMSCGFAGYNGSAIFKKL